MAKSKIKELRAEKTQSNLLLDYLKEVLTSMNLSFVAFQTLKMTFKRKNREKEANLPSKETLIKHADKVVQKQKEQKSKKKRQKRESTKK